jgi:hypothetical protein
VHGAFSGYTGFTAGLVNTHYVYLPIETIIQVGFGGDECWGLAAWGCPLANASTNSVKEGFTAVPDF